MLTIQEANFDPRHLTWPALEGLIDYGIGNSTVASSGPLYNARVIPLKAPFTPRYDAVLGDVEVADYNGAAQQALTWTTAVHDEAQNPYAIANRLTFTPSPTGDTPSQTIHGLALIGSDSVTLLGVFNLADPVLVDPDTPLRVDLTFSLLPAANPG